MMETSLRELQARIWKHQQEHFDLKKRDLNYFLSRCVYECGELGNLIMKIMYYCHDGADVKQKLKKEFGDVLVFLCLAASHWGVDLEQALEETLAINNKRLQEGYYGKLQRKSDPSE